MPVLSGPVARTAAEFDVEFDPAWAVRSMFGGAVAATAVRTARTALALELPLADALFAFLAPTPPGLATLSVRPTRRGRRFAGAEVLVRSGGVETMSATLAFAPSAASPAHGSGPSGPTPGHGGPAFDGAVRWEGEPPTVPGRFDAWVQAVGRAARMPFDEWACIAADLIGPAVAPEVGGPFAVATASLSLSILSPADPAAWWRQSVAAVAAEGVAVGVLDLSDTDGALIARASQRAVIVGADASEMPRSVTAFADSGDTSHMFGMN